MTEAPSSGHALPPGSLNFNGFSFFNAVSFQIILGSPVILFAKSLGASSFILGVLVSLTPLLTILQLWAARFLHRTGYRNFVLAGWGSRTIFTLCIACLPLWPGISDRTRLAWLLVALFGFNSLRGFASGAWLPWLTALVPENVRGRFLSRDQAFMHTGCLVALLVSSWVMSGPVVEADYAIVFGIGAVAAVISLWFIRRIPEAQTQEQRRESAVLVPWRAMLAYKPFLRLLFFSMLYSVVIGGVGVFTVEFLVVREKFGEGIILFLGGLSFIGALAGLALTGPWLDATGSKPWLRRALLLFELVIGGWCLMSGRMVPAWPVLVGALNFFGGFAGAMFGVASTRIVMGSVPVMGRNHFFALYAVVSGLGLGGAPMVWGAVLDTLGTLEVAVGGVSVNRYTIYFAALILLAVWVRSLAGNLHEGVSKQRP
jgi:MFS family permease